VTRVLYVHSRKNTFTRDRPRGAGRAAESLRLNWIRTVITWTFGLFLAALVALLD
jgi:hypothetical protein